MLRFHAVVIPLFVYLGLVHSSHLRAGIIQWRPLNATNYNGYIEITHRIAWRRGWYNCDSSTISSRTLIGGGSLNCRSGCSGSLGSMSFYCTDFSVAEDWTSGERTYTSYIGSVSSFEASFSGCCWISLVSGSWSVTVRGTLTPRSDNGLINSSPVTAITPIVRMQLGCAKTFNIPVQDADNDDIRCRWASGSTECAGVCQRFPYATLNGCSLQYNGGGSSGWYAVALQIEDFMTTSSSTALSSVPLQFLVQIFSSSLSCTGNKPVLVGETIPDGACIAVPFTTTFRTSVVAFVGHTSVRISDFPTVSPLGVQKSSIFQSVYNSSLYYTNITWTPQSSQYGLNILCYSARDSNSLISNQFCITLLGGVQGPRALQNTTSPTVNIIPGQSVYSFSVTFDQEIGRPSRRSYIRVYELGGSQVVVIDVTASGTIFPPSGSGGRMLTFTTSYAFQSGKDYYIVFDLGVAVGSAFCNQDSLPVLSQNFWQFSVGRNECALGLDNCSSSAICIDTASSYSCVCNTGYSGDGVVCTDIDECLLMLAVCPSFSECTNIPGSYLCTCLFGQSIGGVSCNAPSNPNPPGSLQVINISPTSATISWTSPVSQARNEVTDFIVTLSEQMFGLPAINITQNSSNVSYTFTGLEEFNSYRCDIVSVTVYGLASATSSITFSTLARAPAAAPVNITGVAVSPTLIQLSWTDPPLIDINGNVLFYLVAVTEVYTGRNFTFHAAHTQITLGPLHKYYEYSCSIAVYTIALGPFANRTSVWSGEDVPSAAPSALVANTTTHSISLSWNPPPFHQRNGLIRYYIIYVTELAGANTTRQLTSTTTNLLITNLLPSYCYELSVAAYTVGAGPSVVKPFTCLDIAAPSAPPNNVRGYTIDHISIYLGWELPPLSKQNGIIVMYLINVTEVQTGSTFQENTTQTSIIFTSLHPDYNYSFKVAAVTIAPGPYSFPEIIRTHPGPPSAPPRNFVAIFPDPYSARLSWDPPRSEDRNGQIILYTINVTVDKTGDMIQLFTNQTSILIDNLQPFTTYICLLAAETKGGIGPFSTAYVVTTPEDIPSQPLGLGLSRIAGNPTDLSVNWMKPTVLNGNITHYTVYCEENYMFSLGSGNSLSLSPVDMGMENGTVVGGNSTSVVVIGLLPFTTYDCFVTASTSAGEGNSSVVVSATTDESVPGDTPASFVALGFSSASANLTWKQPTIPNGIIVSYNISYNLTNGQTSVLVNVGLSSYVVTGLDAFTYYEFVIFASTRIGNGPTTTAIIQTREASPDSPPLNIATSVSGSTTSGVSWLPPVVDDQNGIIIYYSLVLRDLQFNTSDTVLNTSSTGYTFTNLEEYTRYSFQVAAATMAGLGPFSHPVDFVTHEDVPYAPPQSVTGVVRSSTLVTFSWSPPPPVDVNGIINHYTVRITERHTTRMWTFFTVGVNINIGSLHPYYYYDCIVSTFTIGPGPFSEVTSLRTDQAAPTAPPDQLSALVSADSLTLMWNSPPFEDTNGVIQYYMARIVEKETGKQFTLTATSTVVVFNNLHPYYKYECSVTAYTIAFGPYSDVIILQLDEEAPTDGPTNILGNSLSSDSIHITWEPPPRESQNGLIRSYTINITEIETGFTHAHSSASTEITLFSLHPFYSYEISISAVTIAPGPSSIPIVVQTDPNVPNATVQNPAVSLVTFEAVFLSWDPLDEEDQNGIILGYNVNVTVVSTGYTFQLSTTTASISVTSLKPFSVYIFHVAAFTEVGDGPYSIAINVTTQETAPSSPPDDLELSADSSSSMSISWSPPPVEDHNGIIRRYIINITEVETDREILLTSTSTFVHIQSLHPFYTYDCIISAFTVADGPYSDIVTITTPEDVPSGRPQNVTNGSIRSRSAVITWEPPSEEDQNGIITNYTISVAVTGTNETFLLYSVSTSITIATLKPYTTYFLRVAASTSVGQGPPSTVLILSTPEDVPTSPPQLTGAVVRDSRTVILSWSPPDSDKQNGLVREYRIRLTELHSGNVSLFVSLTTNLEITSLHPDFTYEWIVAAFTIGVGPYSTVFNFTTPENVPSGSPHNILVPSVTSTSVRVVWESPLIQERNGKIVGYTLEVTRIGTGSVYQLTSDEASLNITGLAPFTKYSIVIAARTAIGTGPFSVVITVCTEEDAPSSHPRNTSGTALNSTHIYLTWDPPPENTINGIIREYRINITEDQSGTQFRFNTSQIRELTIGPLHPYYTYHCYIVAYTVEPGPFTDVIIVQTEEAAPSGPPQNFMATAHDSHSIMLSWAPPYIDQQNGILRQYMVTLTSYLGVATHTTSASSLSMIVTGLRPHTAYKCSVAVQTVSLGPQSTAIDVTTPEDIPTGPPQSVASLAINPWTLFIQWESPALEHRNGIIRRYIVNVTEQETGKEEQFYTEKFNITLDSRHPSFQYSYFVSAQSIALGPFSQAQIISMPEAAPSMSPTNLLVINSTSRSFYISWSSPPFENRNGIIRSFDIILIEENTGKVTEVSTQKTAELFENLHPYYNYSFKIAAITIAVGPFSQIQTVLTLEDVPVSPPQNFTGVAESSTSILLSWEPPAVEDRSGVILGYTLNIAEVSQNASIVVTTSDVAQRVEELRPFTAYLCSVIAFTVVGNGPLSLHIPLMTHEDAPGGPPTMVQSSVVTATAVMLTWSPPDTELHNGIIRHYLVSVYERDTGRNFTVQSRADTEFTIGELHPYYTYEFSVQAVTIKTGPVSSVLSLITAQDAPTDYPREIEAFAMDSTTLVIEWEPPLIEYHNGIIVDYCVNVTAVETGTMIQVATGGITSASIPGLHPFYTYTYVVAAATAIGRGPFTMSSSIQMPTDAPSSHPLGLTGESVNSTSILINWQHPEAQGRNGIIISYTILLTEIQTNSTSAISRMGTHLDLLVTHLHPYYWYECSVAAETSSGRGPFTPAITLRTMEDAPSGPPLSVNVTATSSMTIHVTWEPPQPKHQNGIIEEYSIIIKNTVTNEDLYLNTSAMFAVVGNLHPHYSYIVSVAASTVSIGPFSDGTPVTLPPDLPTGVPQNVEVVSVSSTSIRISWEPPQADQQNGDISSYRLTVTEFETGAVFSLKTVPTDNLFVVNSLHPFYLYNCSIAAFTVGLGPRKYVSVRTLPEESSEVPQDITVSALSSSSAIIQWKPPPAEHQNGIVVGYSVRVSSVDTTDEEIEFSVNNSSAIVSDLHPFYSYRFAVAAVTVAVGPFSNPITLQMPEAAPSAPVENVTTLAVSETSVTLAWYPPNPNEWNGLIVQYTIEYELIESVGGHSDSTLNPVFTRVIPSFGQPLMNSDDPTRVRLPLNMEMALIDELEEYHVYRFWVYFETSEGRNSNSDFIEIETSSKAPSGPPTSVSAAAASASSIRVLWSPPEVTERNGVITGYKVLLTDRGSLEQTIYNASGDTFNLQIEGLDTFTEFAVSVAARTSVGIGPFSQPIIVKTLESLPGAPANVIVKVENATAVSITWSEPNNPNGNILEYQIIFFGFKTISVKVSLQTEIVDGPHILTVKESQNTLVVMGLQPGLFYNITVRARTSIGFGENSTSIQVELLQSSVTGTSIGGSDASGAVAIAVLGWVLLIVIVVIVVAVYILRRKNVFKKSAPGGFLSRSRNNRPIDDDRIYDIPGAFSVNPQAIESDECEKVFDIELTPASATEKPSLEFSCESDLEIDSL